MGPYAKLRQATDEKARFYTRLDPDARLIALESEAQLNKTEATETGATFTKGDALRRVQEALVDSTFDEWLRLVWPYDRKYAFRFIKVSKTLSEYKDRLIVAGVPRASLFHLSRAPEMVDDVLDAIRNGKRPTVAEISGLVSRRGSTDGSSEREVGGAKGVRRYHAAKWGYAQQFFRRLRWIYNRVQIALEGSTGPRALRRALAEVVVPSRFCILELRSLCLHPVPHPTEATTISWSSFPSGSRWAQLMKALEDLSQRSTWPGGHKLGDWLRLDVLPVLDWSIGDSRTARQAVDRHRTAPDAGSARTRAIEYAGIDSSTVSDHGSHAASAYGTRRPPVRGTGHATGDTPEGIHAFANLLAVICKRGIRQGLPPERTLPVIEHAASSIGMILTKVTPGTTSEGIAQAVKVNCLAALDYPSDARSRLEQSSRT